MIVSRRLLIAAASSAAMLGMLPGAAGAADYPNKPVRIVVPVPPGGPTDIIARLVAEGLQKKWGQPVVVENKPGASGIIANEDVAAAPADGHTVLVGNVSTNAINVAAYPHRKAAASLIPVTNLIQVPGVFVGNTTVPANSAKELIEGLRSGAIKSIKYGSPGIGTYPQLDALMLFKKEGVKATHIPYKGAAQILPALLANEIQVEFLNESTAIGQIKDGKLKPYAVTWSERLPELSDVPTMTELGYAGIGTSAWHGMFVTGGTPKENVDKLQAAVVEVLADPDIRQKTANQYLKLVPSKSAADFASFVKAETAKWGTVLAENEIKLPGQ
jgi:tripartite-type tricarboxylate transporter receptor subunit TctC